MELFIASGNELHNRGQDPELGKSEIVDGARVTVRRFHHFWCGGARRFDLTAAPLVGTRCVQVLGLAQDHTSPKKSRV